MVRLHFFLGVREWKSNTRHSEGCSGWQRKLCDMHFLFSCLVGVFSPCAKCERRRVSRSVALFCSVAVARLDAWAVYWALFGPNCLDLPEERSSTLRCTKVRIQHKLFVSDSPSVEERQSALNWSQVGTPFECRNTGGGV